MAQTLLQSIFMKKELLINMDQELPKSELIEGAKALISCCSDITALFCANDNTAIGAMSALQEMGLSVPKDVSVIGVDNIATSRYLTPSLTTIAIPIEEMGKTAAKLLHDRIRGGHQIQIKAMLPSKIETRESCMKLKTPK